jgi:hypothetical protein
MRKRSLKGALARVCVGAAVLASVFVAVPAATAQSESAPTEAIGIDSCDTDRRVDYITQGRNNTRRVKVITLVTGCVQQQYQQNPDGSQGPYICSFIHSYSEVHQNQYLSQRAHLIRAWGPSTSQIPHTVDSTCGGFPTPLTINDAVKNARYRWNIPAVPADREPVASPGFLIKHHGNVSETDALDYGVGVIRETIIQLTKRGDWHF